ncbi:MAG: PA14 domain-containing protein, partial [Solirubrobacteraceae bacterium]
MTPPELIDARTHRLRLVQPGTGEGATKVLLGKTYGFTWLPTSIDPRSDDFVEGSYTGRLGDSGEGALTFPNTAGSLGLWREVFDPDGLRQFVEVYRDDELEFIGAVQRVELDAGTVQVGLVDAWWLLRRAYERDRTWGPSAPRDVIDAYTRVPVPIIAEPFTEDPDDPTLPGDWQTYGTPPVSASVEGSSVKIEADSGLGGIYNTAVPFSEDAWRANIAIDRVEGPVSAVTIIVRGPGGVSHAFVNYGLVPNRVELQTSDGVTNATVGAAVSATPVEAGRITVTIERQGRWIFASVNGTVVGPLACPPTDPTDLVVSVSRSGSSGVIRMYVDEVTVTELRPFLLRGHDTGEWGEFHLPGDYPSGGLRGRFWNDADLQGLAVAERAVRILAPGREPYAERLDKVVDTAQVAVPAQPGSSANYWSARWSGAVYLEAGRVYSFQLNIADGVRLWVGNTAWGTQIIDEWQSTGARNVAGTYVVPGRSGWYPIVLEHYHSTTVYGIQMFFRVNTGGGYTDPGGTAVSTSYMIVPQTSLSPLGCYEGRVQGQSHFDVVSAVAQQYGYQLRCEPRQFEQADFPGRLRPLERVGRDTDVVLEVDLDDRGEPFLSPGATFDASDQATTLIGTGAGISDARGQTLATIADTAAMRDALFALESWVDAGEVGNVELLRARLNAELALRATPWEEVRGVPRAQERLADTWPLSGSLEKMRWHPGDGVRLFLPDVRVEDV